MISEYLILISLIIVSIYFTILAVTTVYLSKQKTIEKNQNKNVRNKITTYLKIFFFFLVSIIITRLVFSLYYPQQLYDLGIDLSIESWPFYFLLLQISIVLLYISFIFFFILFLKLCPESRISYLLRVLKINLSFSILDLLITGTIYFKINTELLWMHIGTKRIIPSADNYALVLIAVAGIISCIVIYFLTQAKATRNLQNWFFGIIMATLYISIMLGYGNLHFIIPERKALNIFIYYDVYFAWLWLGLIFLTLIGQTAVGVIYEYKKKFVNRFFAVNYIKQINRISIISILGISIIGLLPQIYLIIFSG